MNEKIFVEINGAMQGMFLQSENTENPVLLFLHGGAGSPEIAFTEKYPTGLEALFTVCWWEQRGSGLSFNHKIKPEEMTLEQMISDTIAVTHYLCKRFGKEKIYVMGHSWGALLGVLTVQRQPALFHGYIARRRIVMSSNLRKWTGVFLMVVCYYITHEGAHLIVALSMGTFEHVKIVFPGIQVVANIGAMSDLQCAIFCVVGALSTLCFGYVLVLSTKHILQLKNKVAKATFYYTTLGLLLCDPIYLSVLCGFFGGGDMNGIILFGIPEIVARIAFGVIGIINVYVFIKFVYPPYKVAFSEK